MFSARSPLQIWSVAGQKFVCTLSGHINWVRACQFAPDGRLAVSGGDDKTVKIWDVTSKKLVSNLIVNDHVIKRIAVHLRRMPLVIAVYGCLSPRCVRMLLACFLDIKHAKVLTACTCCAAAAAARRFTRTTTPPPASTVWPSTRTAPASPPAAPTTALRCGTCAATRWCSTTRRTPVSGAHDRLVTLNLLQGLGAMNFMVWTG